MSDVESELVYNRNRMFNPTLDRWMQRDILQYIDGMSRYNYLGSNPLMRIDPTGKFWHIVIGGIIGGVVGAIAAATLNPALGLAAVGGLGTTGTLIVGGAISGTASGLGSGIVGETFDAATGGTFDLNDVAESTITGTVGGIATGGILGFPAGLGGGTVDDALNVLDDVTTGMLGGTEAVIGNTVNIAIDENNKCP